MKRLLPIAAIAVLAAGCNTSGCLENRNAIPLAALYSSATGQAITVSGIQISGVDVPNDSILVGPSELASEIYLPMRSEHNSVQWCFHYTQEGLDDDAFNDTITFRYTSLPYFASAECGASYRYTITEHSTTTHLIDSLVVLDPLITNVDMVRIRIYLRTAEPEQ